jgi:putative aminopeptidase FrvX
VVKYSINGDTLQEFLVGLLQIPSPTGFHEKAIEYCEEAFRDLPATLSRTRKGALIGVWEGDTNDSPRGITAHVDTLGAVVNSIKKNGRLTLSQIGGWAWGSVEGEGITVHTRSDVPVRGTILPVRASVHIYGPEARTFKREECEYEVRLDARTTSEAETHALGIDVGDFVAFDPRVEVSPSGFIRSRHLDDKAGVACLYSAAATMAQAGLKPAQKTILHVSNYEEVGHGAASGWPSDLAELLTIDMAAAGGPQNSDEFSVGICIKDSGGPYHLQMTRQLQSLAEANHIPYKNDVYPFYGSDGEAF